MHLQTIVIEGKHHTPGNFVPCEQLFPQWRTARIILNEFVNRIGRFRILATGSTLNLHIEQGYSIEAIPPEDREKARYILESTCAQAVPDLSQFLHQAINESTIHNILGVIQNHAMERLHRGEPSLRDDLRFNFGLTPLPQFDH